MMNCVAGAGDAKGARGEGTRGAEEGDGGAEGGSGQLGLIYGGVVEEAGGRRFVTVRDLRLEPGRRLS